MDLLARREHGVAELALKLRQKGFLPADIDIVLPQLVADNLLSDERFAFEYTRSRQRRGFGPRRISLELQERGIDPEVIRSTLAEYQIDEWQKTAQAVWRKKFATLPTDFKALANQKRFLAYRGFADEHCEWLCYENQ